MSDGSPGPGGGEFAPGAFRARFPRWVWVGLASWLLAGGLLLVVPALLGWLGGRYQNDVTDELSSCRTSGLAGLDDAETADRIFRVQSWFPFWAPRAAPKRAELVAQVAAGVEACRRGGSPPAGLVERGVGFAAGGLPDALGAAADPDALRRRVEEFLLAFGREKELVALEGRLPQGGDVELRVRAHLRLGDPAGAARVWRAPGAATSPRTATWLGKGVVLCLAGDHDAALPELERHWHTRVEAERSGTWRAEFLGVVAECALRAGDDARLAASLDEMPGTRRGRAIAFRYSARSDPAWAVASLRRRLALDPDGENDRSTLDDQVFALSLLAGAGALDELPAYADGGAVRRELAALEANPPVESLYDDRLHPPFDEDRMRQAIDALAGLESPAARDAAAGLAVLLAVRLGRRWDERMSEELARAAAFRPGWTLPDRIGATFRDLHGEGPDGASVSPATSGQALDDAQRGAGSPATLSALFLRLTRVVVAGRAARVDVRRWEDQLAALRAMVEAQPSGRVLRFVEPL